MTAKQLRKHRERSGRTKAEQAIYLGYPFGTYSKYETKKGSLPEHVDRRVALADKDFDRVARLIKREIEEFDWSKEDIRKLGDELKK